MENRWNEVRVLIWGKTYPELSSKYYETVCTGGTLNDGRFVRLYPIPFRYLSDTKLFAKYQWVRLRIKKAKDDPRPESYKVEPTSIVAEEWIPSDKHAWRVRSSSIFKNPRHQFESVEALLTANKTHRTSLGFVRPKCIDDVEIESRPASEYQDFMRRLKANEERTKQSNLFERLTVQELKSLQYVAKRFKIHWHCHGSECKGHRMSILDWEAYELVRREGLKKARDKVEQILDLSQYATGFFLGNFRRYQSTFAIGGIWYPKQTKKTETPDLFGEQPQ